MLGIVDATVGCISNINNQFQQVGHLFINV